MRGIRHIWVVQRHRYDGDELIVNAIVTATNINTAKYAAEQDAGSDLIWTEPYPHVLGLRVFASTPEHIEYYITRLPVFRMPREGKEDGLSNVS